jgi:hypothetical protein
LLEAKGYTRTALDENAGCSEYGKEKHTGSTAYSNYMLEQSSN